MFNLTPIAESIQKRMYEKMRVLGREKGTTNQSRFSLSDKLTLKKLSTRSTFIRMTSGLSNPVVLMGGMLNENKNMTFGYDNIYGPRTYSERVFEGEYKKTLEQNIKLFSRDHKPGWQGTDEKSAKDENIRRTYFETLTKSAQFDNIAKRPMPGIKSIDVSFKGGVRALREATISWTCWDWGELNNLMPHFLAHGKTVMIEWGWAYDKITLGTLPNFLTKDENTNQYRINASAYKNYKNEVLDAKGDMDLMIGIVKNFEFNTRADGGFDCQTILTSVGNSILESTRPPDDIVTPTLNYKLSKSEKISETKVKLTNALAGNTEDLIEYDLSTTLKSFIRNIDRYIYETSRDNVDITGQTNSLDSKGFQDRFYGVKNKYIVQFHGKADAKFREEEMVYENAWVQWGWFEDNVLSNFLTLVSDDSENPIVAEFRSVERISAADGSDSDQYESVRILNHVKLETADINKYILPGQFKPLDIKSFENLTETAKISLSGDSESILKLASLVNGGNFSTFAVTTPKTTTITKTVIDEEKLAKRKEEPLFTDEAGRSAYVMGKAPVKTGVTSLGRLSAWAENKHKTVGPEERIEPITKTITNTITEDVPLYNQGGYLRHMLVNTKLIKQAFGVSTEKSVTAEIFNIREAIENVFYMLNQDLNFWNFELTTDITENQGALSKIVDRQMSRFDFPEEDIDDVAKSKFKVGSGGEISTVNNGIFFFPTWQSDSFVKNHNVRATVPNAMALSIMYGANFDSLKTLGNLPGDVTDSEGAALAALFNRRGYEDTQKGNIDVAIRKPKFENIGGDNIKTWMINNDEALKDSFENKIEHINEQLQASQVAAENEELRKILELGGKNIPPPMPDWIARNNPEAFDKLLEKPKVFKVLGKTIDLSGIKHFFHGLYGSKFYSSGRMKDPFINSITYLTTQHGEYKESTRQLLIPLEIELEIDGIGGIYPGNSFHSNYLPKRYQEESVFQAFDINHRVGSEGWTVTVMGKMRTTLRKVLRDAMELPEIEKLMIEAYAKRNEIEVEKRKQAFAEKGVDFGQEEGSAEGVLS